MRRATRALIAAGLLVVALVAATLIAASLIPEERVAALAAARAEAALGERVRIRTAGLDLFPVPGVRLSGIAVGGTDESAALALVERVDLRPRILPLIRGRVVVSRLLLDRPRLHLQIDADGRPNLPVLSAADEPAAGTPPDAPEHPAPRDIAFQVTGVAIDDGRIQYRDARDGTDLVLDGWNQRLGLSGDIRAGELAAVALEGWLQFDRVTADLPGVVLPARDLRVRLEHDAALALAADRLELRTLSVSLNDVTLSGTGTIDSASSETGRTAALELTANGLDAAELLSWLPPEVRAGIALPDGRGVDVRGSAALRASLAGPLSIEARPSLDGELSVRDVAATAGRDALVSGVHGTAAFSFDSVVARFQGQALGERFQIGLGARNPAAPSVVVSVSGRADLGRLAALGLVADSLGLAGAVNADLRTQFNLRDPATSRAAGTVDLAGITLAGVDPVVRVPAGTLQFHGGRLDASPIRVELGPDRTGLDIAVSADGWIPAAVDSTAPPPRVTAALQADSLDLDALFPADPERPSEYPPLLFARLRDLPIDGRSATEVAEAAALAVPALPPVEADARLAVRRLVRNGLRYDDLDVLTRVTPDVAVIERVRFGFMGGTVQLSGRVEPLETDTAGAPIATRVAGRFTLNNVGAAPFFDRLTPFRNHLTGDLDLAGGVTTTLDRTALPDRNTITADGTLAIANGTLTNWTVLQAATSRLGVNAVDTLRFRDWAGSFRLDGPTLSFEETMLAGGDIEARAAGSLDLAGILDFAATAYLTRALAERAGSIGGDLLAAAESEGRVPVGLRITGRVENPDIAVDLSEARTALVDRAQETVREEARRARGRAEREAEEARRDAEEAARREAEEAANRLAQEAREEVAERFELPDSLVGLPADSLRVVLGDSLYGLVPDSLKMVTDSLAERAEDAIRNRLRRILPGGGGGGGGI